MNDHSGPVSIHHSVTAQRPRVIHDDRQFLAVPHRGTRMIVARLLADVLRLSSHHPQLGFIQAVEITVILTTIFCAECDGKPFTRLGLSKHLEMPRPTLLRRLAYLESRGTIHREAQRLRMNPAIFATPQRDENIRRLRQIIIDAGNALSKMDSD